LPIALAALENAKDERLKVALLLGVCYGCNVGGIGTPVGTPPNLIFMQVYEDTTGIALSFLDWMRWGIPVVVVFVPLIGLWLTRSLGAAERLELPEVGAWRSEERRTLTVFGLTAVAWITRSDPFGGWSGLLDLPQANDASVALIAVVALFLIPNGKGERLLDWDAAVRIPWGILILFSGGICIAAAFVSSGISQIIGETLAALSGIPTLFLIAAICLSVTFLTEITSNTATTALLMPVLAAAAIGAGVDARLLMVPAAMSASCAFMLPVATGPNAVIFASGHVAMRDMVREGLAMNFIGAAVLTAVCYFALLD
jgi:solute carrier family 13 (sodium-dependent dicarboxylate transporter), member 2/3/5